MFETKSIYKKNIDEYEISIICPVNLPLGIFHDFLLEARGWTVDRMVKAQKEDQEISQEMMGSPEEVKTEETTEIEA